MSTVEPLFTVCPAGGDWPMTSPAGAGSACGVTVPTFKPASVIAVLAASSVIPTRLGTSTCFGALPTVIVTVLPFSRSVPGSGLCLMTSPTSAWLIVTWNSAVTSKPASLSVRVAASCVNPRTSGTLTEAALVLSRLDASRYSPPPRTARISKTIRAGIHHRRRSPSPGSTGGSTAVGGPDGAIRWVRALSGRSGVAWTVWPSRARSRSARISSASWYRLSGFFARAFMITASSPGATSRFSFEGGVGCSSTCLDATITGESPENGGRPVTISYSTQPSE